LRAGLLSHRKIIQRLNDGFVSTSIIIDDLTKRAKSGDRLAQQVVGHWEYPLEMMFLTPAGKVVSKLNSYRDFPGVHPDVAAPPKGEHTPLSHEGRHIDIFLEHVADHFDKR
jgi:hypothetical protein